MDPSIGDIRIHYVVSRIIVIDKKVNKCTVYYFLCAYCIISIGIHNYSHNYCHHYNDHCHGSHCVTVTGLILLRQRREDACIKFLKRILFFRSATEVSAASCIHKTICP